MFTTPVSNKLFSSIKVLIVEDEIIIADTIKRYLKKNNYDVVGIAISYEEAISIVENNVVDLALIDIRINGSKSGFDVADDLTKRKIPFIYLSSHVDTLNINKAKETKPIGYLSKPIHMQSLLTTIEIGLSNFKEQKPTPSAQISFKENNKTHIFTPDNIAYVKSEHVYVNLFLSGGTKLLIRQPLQEVLDQLSINDFIQCHRSYVVNIRQVTSWTTKELQLLDVTIPISRSRKNDVLAALNKAN